MLTSKDKILLDYILKEHYGSENQYEIQNTRILVRPRKINGKLILKICKVVDYDFDIGLQIENSPTYKKGFGNAIMFSF